MLLKKILFYSISLISCTVFYKFYLIGEILLKLNINYPQNPNLFELSTNITNYIIPPSPPQQLPVFYLFIYFLKKDCP